MNETQFNLIEHLAKQENRTYLSEDSLTGETICLMKPHPMDRRGRRKASVLTVADHIIMARQ